MNYFGKMQILKKCSEFRGAILIEFAFSVPVLIILLYFVMDGPLAYRISMKLQKIAELTAQMICNVHGTTIEKLTISDLKDISAAAGITLTSRKGTIASPLTNYPFYLSTYVFCVTGIGSNKFRINWNVHIQNSLYDGVIIANKNDSLLYSSISRLQDNLNGTGIKDFLIQKGEIKLIIETVAWYKEGEHFGAGGSPVAGRVQRGFNTNYYLMSIQGKERNGAKTFGGRFTIISSLDAIIDEDKLPDDG